MVSGILGKVSLKRRLMTSKPLSVPCCLGLRNDGQLNQDSGV